MPEGPTPDPDQDDPVAALRRRFEIRPRLPGKPPASSVRALGPPSISVDETALLALPPVAIVVERDRIHVTVELPRTARNSVEARATGTHLEIREYDRGGWTCLTSVDLPESVDPGEVVATRVNDILDMTLTRRRVREPPGEGGEPHA